jgi:hypothetical protein
MTLMINDTRKMIRNNPNNTLGDARPCAGDAAEAE